MLRPGRVLTALVHPLQVKVHLRLSLTAIALSRLLTTLSSKVYARAGILLVRIKSGLSHHLVLWKPEFMQLHHGG